MRARHNQSNHCGTSREHNEVLTNTGVVRDQYRYDHKALFYDSTISVRFSLLKA